MYMPDVKEKEERIEAIDWFADMRYPLTEPTRIPGWGSPACSVSSPAGWAGGGGLQEASNGRVRLKLFIL
jgi:hypothetical protein